MKISLAVVLLNVGQFRDAALAFDPLIPEVGKIANPDRRAAMYIHAARARVFSGHPDEAQELLHEALVLARDYNLRSQESEALQGLGNFYLYRGDTLSAGKVYEEVLKITREQHNTVGINAGLQTAGYVARVDGDYARAIEMHKEAREPASNPGRPNAHACVSSARTISSPGDYPAAIGEFRKALAVELQDPRHHAYSDSSAILCRR